MVKGSVLYKLHMKHPLDPVGPFWFDKWEEISGNVMQLCVSSSQRVSDDSDSS